MNQEIGFSQGLEQYLRILDHEQHFDTSSVYNQPVSSQDVIAYLIVLIYCLAFLYYIYDRYVNHIIEDLTYLIELKADEVWQPIIYCCLNSYQYFVFNIMSMYISQDDLGLSVIISTDSFNIFFLFGYIFVSVLSKQWSADAAQIDNWLFMKDIVWYFLGIGILFVFLYQVNFEWWMAFILLVYYFFFYLLQRNSDAIKNGILRGLGIISEDDSFDAENQYLYKKRRESITNLLEQNLINQKDESLKKQISTSEATLVITYGSEQPRTHAFQQWYGYVYKIMYGIRQKHKLEKQQRSNYYSNLWKEKDDDLNDYDDQDQEENKHLNDDQQGSLSDDEKQAQKAAGQRKYKHKKNQVEDEGQEGENDDGDQDDQQDDGQGDDGEDEEDEEEEEDGQDQDEQEQEGDDEEEKINQSKKSINIEGDQIQEQQNDVMQNNQKTGGKVKGSQKVKQQNFSIKAEKKQKSEPVDDDESMPASQISQTAAATQKQKQLMNARAQQNDENELPQYQEKDVFNPDDDDDNVDKAQQKQQQNIVVDTNGNKKVRPAWDTGLRMSMANRSSNMGKQNSNQQDGDTKNLSDQQKGTFYDDNMQDDQIEPSLKFPDGLFAKLMFIIFFPIHLIIYFLPNYHKNPSINKLIMTAIIDFVIVTFLNLAVIFSVQQIHMGTTIPTPLLGFLVIGPCYSAAFLTYNLKFSQTGRQNTDYIQAFMEIGIFQLGICIGFPMLLSCMSQLTDYTIWKSNLGVTYLVLILAFMLFILTVITLCVKFKYSRIIGYSMILLWILYLVTGFILIEIYI